MHELPINATLDDGEWQIMHDWYATTAARDAIGEINVPAMSLLQGLVMGNGLRRIVQLGHFYGYSALLIGFWLRRWAAADALLGRHRRGGHGFYQQWVDRRVCKRRGVPRRGFRRPGVGDAALEAIGGAPEARHRRLVPPCTGTPCGARPLGRSPAAGGLVLLHDVSVYAQSFDPAGAGGVRRALAEWVGHRDDVALLNLNGDLPESIDPNRPTYKDGCGMGILQRVA